MKLSVTLSKRERKQRVFQEEYLQGRRYKITLEKNLCGHDLFLANCSSANGNEKYTNSTRLVFKN